jgi:hypothetical protein
VFLFWVSNLSSYLKSGASTGSHLMIDIHPNFPLSLLYVCASLLFGARTNQLIIRVYHFLSFYA